MVEWYQLQASSPITSRLHQAYSAITGLTGYVLRVMALIESPATNML